MRSRHAISVLLAAALAAAGVVSTGPPASAARAPTPGITDWHPCPDRPDVQCGSLQVPLDWARPHGPKISLAVARNPVDDPAQRVGALFVNPGGPGGPGVVLRGVRRPDLLARTGQALRPGRHRPARHTGQYAADPVHRQSLPAGPDGVPAQRGAVPALRAGQPGVRPELCRRHRTADRTCRHGVGGPRPRGGTRRARRAEVQLARSVVRHPDRHAVRQPVPAPCRRAWCSTRSWTTAWGPSACCWTRPPRSRIRSTGSRSGVRPPRPVPCTDVTSPRSTTRSWPMPIGTRCR